MLMQYLSAHQEPENIKCKICLLLLDTEDGNKCFPISSLHKAVLVFQGITTSATVVELNPSVLVLNTWFNRCRISSMQEDVRVCMDCFLRYECVSSQQLVTKFKLIVVTKPPITQAISCSKIGCRPSISWLHTCAVQRFVQLPLSLISSLISWSLSSSSIVSSISSSITSSSSSLLFNVVFSSLVIFSSLTCLGFPLKYWNIHVYMSACEQHPNRHYKNVFIIIIIKYYLYPFVWHW